MSQSQKQMSPIPLALEHVPCLVTRSPSMKHSFDACDMTRQLWKAKVHWEVLKLQILNYFPKFMILPLRYFSENMIALDTYC